MPASSPKIALDPLPTIVQIYVENKDNSFHTVYVASPDAGQVAIDEVMKDSTRHVVLRRMRLGE